MNLQAYRIGRYVPGRTFPGRHVALAPCVQYIIRDSRGRIVRTSSVRNFV